MSVRESRRPGRRRVPLHLALVLGVATLVAGPASMHAFAVVGLGLTTPFPAVVVEPGGSASFELSIDVTTARRVDLSARGLPAGWTGRFRGGGAEVDGAFVDPESPPKVTYSVDVPSDAAAGVVTLTLEARSGSLAETLVLAIRVAEQAGGSVSLESDFPELRGPSDATYTFTVRLRNDTPAEATFGFGATGPDGWTVTAKPSGQDLATSTTVGAGSTGTLTVSVRPAPDAAAATYPVTLEVSGGGKSAKVDLAVVITGTYAMTVSTPDQVLSATANAGSPRELEFSVLNTGTAPITGITPSASTPNEWTLTFDPPEIASIDPGQTVTVKGTLTPSNQAIAGDYQLTVTATGAEARDSVDIRVRVETPQFWWIVGVGLIGLTFAGLYWVFRTYGRR